MYNGIGLTTPRGSGTNGYVTRNLSVLRNFKPAEDRAAAWTATPPRHREPDPEILEHERKRNVEVKCLDLRLKLEDEGVEEDRIEEQVVALRKTLLDTLPSVGSAKLLKSSDTHGLAVAKKQELDKMARALGTRTDYQEGDAFDREKQAENKVKRLIEREEKERRREEERASYEKQKQQWEAEKKERDRLRRREEDKIRKMREQEKERMPPPLPPVDRTKERERGYREYRRDERKSRSPQRRPAPREDRAVDSRRVPRSSVSPPPRRRPDSRSQLPRDSRRSPSPPRKRFRDERGDSKPVPPDSRATDRPPRDGRGGHFSPRRRVSHSPDAPRSKRRDSRSLSPRRSPVPRASRGRARSPSSSPPRSRGRSASSNSAMSVSTSSSQD